MSEQNQIDWEKGTIQEPNQTDWENGQISQPIEKKGKGVKGHLQDTGLSALKGAIAVPELAVGVMDMMSDGATGKTLENKDGAVGFRPKEAKQALSDLHTDQYKAQQQEFADAGKDGNWVDKVVDKTKVALTNPSLITNTVVESVPSMLAGGVLGRASGIANPVVAGAVGEGAVMAGSQAEQIRQETVDGRLTADQSLAGAATGALGGLIGFAGGRLAQKMGIGDVDTMLVTGRAGPAEIAGEIASMPAKSLPRRVVEGAISEGFLEELPQSVSEQILQNLALDKPWYDGIEDAAVMGTLAGMAMGGTANILSGHNTGTETQDNQQQSTGTPNLPSAPPQIGSSLDNAFTGEYIPRENVPQGDNQGRTAFVYDQPSMEADNLLNNNYKDDADFGTSGNFAPSNNPDSPLSPSGGKYSENHSTQPQLPSERLGLNPDYGPLSSAAALAVNGRATNDSQNEASIANIPSEFTQLLPQQNQNIYQSVLSQSQNIKSDNHVAPEVDQNSVSAKPVFSSNQTIGTMGYAKDIADQAMAQYSGDTNALVDKRASLTGKGAATDLLYYKNSPSFSNVEVEDAGDKSIVKLTNAKTGSITEREYPAELVRFNQFLDEVNQPDYGNVQAQNVSENVSNLKKTNPLNSEGMQPSITTETANFVSKNVSDQISELEQEFAAAKTVPQKAKLRKQIDQLKTQQLNDNAVQVVEPTQPEKVSPSIRDSFNQELDHGVLNIPLAKRGNIDNQLDQYKKQQAANEKEKRDIQKMAFNDVQKIAKPMFETLNQDHIQHYATKANITLSKAKQELKSMGHWQPKKAIKVYQALKDIVPTDPVNMDSHINDSAHEAATSPLNNLPEPTAAQIEAGNYKKGHIKVQGLDISIENPKGSERRGTDPNGKEWAHRMSDHYGYIKRTKGADNEHIDTYIGNNPDSNQVFIVDQLDQESGNFDEHKVMLGFNNQEEATTAYKSNFDKGWKVGPIKSMSMDEFQSWLKDGDTSKPATSKNLRDSLENIRAEKIRQKNLIDMHNSVYGLASDEQLQESLKLLNKDIAKAHKQSENEVVNGKRSTRKAVAAGALDRFLKDRVDLEIYIKARKNGELQQRSNDTKDYSRDKLKPDNERRGTSPLDTTFNALSVVSATRRVLSVLQHLKLSTTQNSSISGRITVGSAGIKGGFDVQVISSFNGLPAEIQKDATYQDDKGNTQNYDVSAVWHKGTLYVVADQVYGNNEKQLTTFDAYEEMLAHEIIGHFGVQQIFGQEYKTKLQQLYNALGELEGIRKIASKNGVDMTQFESAYIEPYTQGAEKGLYDPLDVQQALVGELFAFVAQNQEKKPFILQKIKEVIGYIRQWFRDRGFNKFLSRYNDADLMMFLSEARKAVVDRSYFGKYKNQEFSSKNDSDTPLYSRSTKSNSGSTVQQVRAVLIDRFGKDTIKELELQGKLEIIQDYSIDGVEGYYHNGKAVLVASNLTAESTVPTFLHELGGHAGFQNMMNQKQYNELMNQFNKLVEQGNPVAMAAKLLAEREQGSERQQLEYLPYLLTLSSTMEQRNVIQRNALQKLINNIVTYVKATLFDNFGINLNLNPNDIVALAERMIEKSSYNAENATSPLYSRQFFDNTINNLSESIKHLSAKSIKDKTGYKFTDWLGIGLSALGRRQLTEIYSKILPQLNKYNDLAAQMDADKNDAGAEADSIVREWANLKDEDQLAELMHDSTLAKIDPTKPYVKGDSVSRYKQLRDDYNSLSPEAQAMYLKARDAYKKHYAKVHQAIKERILRSELSNQKKADLLKQMDDNFFGYVKGVYFPLARFGKYVVVMRNQNGEVESVSRAETMGEAQSLRSELMQKYPQYKIDRVMLDKEFNASRDAVGRGFMTNLFAEVDNLGLSTAEQAEFEDTLSQLYLSSMPDLSWAKHGIHRKGTAGFSQDARRAFAQNMFHGARYLAKLRYGDQLAQQLDDMQKYASEQSKLNDSYDQPTAQRVIDEMNKRHDNLMNPKSHPLSSALTSFGFIYYLGLSPAAAMVNLSQTALVAYPIMGAKWGFDKAANELLKASNDFRKGVEFHKVKWEGSKTDLYKTISSDISKFLSKDEKQAYEDAVARGVIDVTQAHDLAGIAQGEDSGIMWKTRPIMRAASVMFHSAERFNREVTFIAAYRLARQSGEKHDSAFDQAVDATYRGHFDYSSGNRPRIMQGNVAKVLLLFKQFGQNMVYTLARQTYQSIKGETEAERKEARKSLGAILAMHATFAGTLGLPMVGMLLSLASWAGGDDDDPWDAEVALRNYLAEAFGPTISTLLMKGAPRAFTPFDMSGRVGINNMLLPDVQEGLEGKRWAESAMAGALGPVAGIGTNLVKGGQDITEGQTLRGIETMLPVFLKNFAKTYRYADEGVQDKTGVSIMDEVSSMDLLVQGMGFSLSDVRTANEGKTAIYQLNRKLNERRSRLMTLWSRAKMMDDQQEMDEIWEEIQGFNDKNPSRRITRINLNQSYRNRQRRIDRAEDGIYLSRNRQDAREAGYFAFGE